MFHFCCEFCCSWGPNVSHSDIDCGWRQLPEFPRAAQLTFYWLLWPQWTEIPPLMSCLGFSRQGLVGFCCLQARMLQRHRGCSWCSLRANRSQGIWWGIYRSWFQLVSEHQSYVSSHPSLDSCCEVERERPVFSSLTASFFNRYHHLVHGFVGEWTVGVPHEVFSKFFLAAFEQLYDHVFAFEFCRFGIIFPPGKEVRPLFTRFCRQYGWSPHFLNRSGCLYSGLTSGLHMCHLSGQWEVQRQVRLLHLLSRTRIPGTSIYVLALCVFLVATFPRSWVLSWHENNKKAKMVVKGRRSI